MSLLFGIVVFVAALLVGIWGFSQIVGTFQNLHVFNPVYSLYVITIWSGILLGGWCVVHRFLPVMIFDVYGGYIISLLMVLSAGRIR